MITRKLRPSRVRYRPGGPNHRCGVCINYRVPHTCRVVEVKADPDMVCDMFNVDPYTVGDEGD